jgi:hypothetical protein
MSLLACAKEWRQILVRKPAVFDALAYFAAEISYSRGSGVTHVRRYKMRYNGFKINKIRYNGFKVNHGPRKAEAPKTKTLLQLY